jgi:hypothetical protein
MSDLNELPEEVQASVKSTLRAYDRTSVVREDGQFRESPSTCIKANYADDYKVWRFKAEDIYTPEERMLNYVNAFGEYPARYKGQTQYPEILDFKGDYYSDKKAVMIKGNIVLVKK